MNTICHLANHFVADGVGVRFLCDVWVNRNVRKPEPNWEIVNAELEHFGLLDFARNIEDLVKCWFDGGEETALLQELGDYILSEGQSGEESRKVLNAAALSAKQSGASVLLKRIFPSREDLESRFSWCVGKPLLLPVAWLVRCFRVVTRRAGISLQWTKEAGKLTKEEISQQKEKLGRFGIAPKK